jgi:hypothetical protein
VPPYISYFCIPLALVYLARRRRDLPFYWIFWMFGLSIVGCGTTHGMEIWTVWHASYLLAGVVKAITVVVSVAPGHALFVEPEFPESSQLDRESRHHTMYRSARVTFVAANSLQDLYSALLGGGDDCNFSESKWTRALGRRRP